MNLRKLLLTENNCYKAGKIITPKGILVHSTGANNTKLSRYVNPDDGLLGKNLLNNHWNVPLPGGGERCVHAFIGKLKDGTIATYQTLPWNFRGWHAGGSANNTHIGFEICEDGLTDPVYFKQVYTEAVEFSAYLCKMFNLNPLVDGVIICHSEGYKRGIASNHGDVMHWFPRYGKSMDTFRSDVAKLLNTEVEDMAEIEKLKAQVSDLQTKLAAETDAKNTEWMHKVWAEEREEKLIAENITLKERIKQINALSVL